MLIKKDVLILGEGPTQGLHGTTLTAEKNYSVYFDLSRKKNSLNLHYNGGNNYIFVNGADNIKFKATDF